MSYKFNPFTGELDNTGAGSSSSNTIPEYTSDPPSPSAEDAWVLHTTSGGVGGGTPLGLLLALTTPSTGGSDTYEFRYRTAEGTTVGVTLN